MRHQKRFTVLLGVVLTLLFISETRTAFAASLHFTDVPYSAWYYQEVQYVYENALMNGTTNTTFEPQGRITRGMIVTILHRLDKTLDVTSVCPFQDVNEGRYYRDAITWAASHGIVNGYTSDTFGPDDAITRQQMAAILFRYTAFKGHETFQRADLGSYTDVSQISPYALEYMAWANATGLINGNSARELMPRGNATRAQAAAILTRFCRNVIGNGADTADEPSSAADSDTLSDTPDTETQNKEAQEAKEQKQDTQNQEEQKQETHKQNTQNQEGQTAPAASSDKNVFQVTSTESANGTTAFVTVTLGGEVYLCGFDMVLHYDKTLFELQEMDTERDLEIYAGHDIDTGHISFNYASAKNINKPKEILALSFKLIGNPGQSGTFSIVPVEVIQTDDRDNVVSAEYRVVNNTLTIR